MTGHASSAPKTGHHETKFSTAAATDRFYDDLMPFPAFRSITDASRYRPLPSDWIVGVTDIIHSTEAIAEGRYKAVNTAGAAVLAAVTNALPDVRFPFVFNGDGASFALPGRYLDVARDVLARTAAWAEDALGLVLRTAVIPVAEVRAHGFDVHVARFAPSQHVSYAMFAGGGLAWADAMLKQGRFAIARAATGTTIDLTGLTCPFAPVLARRGVILSIIVLPAEGGQGFATLVADLLAMLEGSGTAGCPLPERGPSPAWTGGGLDGAIARGKSDFGPLKQASAVAQSVVKRLAHLVGMSIGGIHSARFQLELVQNSDFRKFDDGLRMTVDCTLATADAVEERLAAGRQAGICHFGAHRQSAANVTCFVPSATRSDHMHFVDGAAGGYASAAAKLKRNIPPHEASHSTVLVGNQ